MDGREAMALSRPTSYYIHRGINGSGSGVQTGLHGPADIQSFSILSLIVRSNIGSPISSRYGAKSTTTISPHVVSMASPLDGMTPVEQKRGRGRPPGSGKKQQLSSLGEVPTMLKFFHNQIKKDNNNRTFNKIYFIQEENIDCIRRRSPHTGTT